MELDLAVSLICMEGRFGSEFRKNDGRSCYSKGGEVTDSWVWMIDNVNGHTIKSDYSHLLKSCELEV